MGIYMEDTKTEVKHKCAKCKKEKTEAEGVYVLEGMTFCCKDCCGDPAKGQDKEKKENVCEFC